MTPSVREARAAVPPYSQLTAQSLSQSSTSGPVHEVAIAPRRLGLLVPLLLTLMIVGAFAVVLWWTA
jgi:hypothetical protein